MFCVNLKVTTDFPDGSDSKESNCNAGDLGLIPRLRRSPGGGHDKPLQYSCLENFHGQRSLMGYSPWRCKDSDMTERLSTAHCKHKEEISIRHTHKKQDRERKRKEYKHTTSKKSANHKGR